MKTEATKIVACCTEGVMTALLKEQTRKLYARSELWLYCTDEIDKSDYQRRKLNFFLSNKQSWEMIKYQASFRMRVLLSLTEKFGVDLGFWSYQICHSNCVRELMFMIQLNSRQATGLKLSYLTQFSKMLQRLIYLYRCYQVLVR